jgi:hypothetical protein
MQVITRVVWTRWGLARWQAEVQAALNTPGAVLDHMDVAAGFPWRFVCVAVVIHEGR